MLRALRQGKLRVATNLVVALVVLVLVAQIIVVLQVVFVLELVVKVVLQALLKLQGLAREPVNRPWDELLLDVFAELVVELKTLLDVFFGLLVVVRRRLWRVEEVEEGFGRDGLFDNAGLLGIYKAVRNVSKDAVVVCWSLLLFRCFLLSIFTVRSLPAFHSISSPSAWS